MHKRTVIALLIAPCFLSGYAPAQHVLPATPESSFNSAEVLEGNLSASVVPITSVKFRGPFLQADMGTGFCLDPECRLIGTNYHVAVAVKCRKIEATRIVQRYLATGPADHGATLNNVASGGSLRYALNRDLAVFELAKPLAHHHGLDFSTDDLLVGQRVSIYAYPAGTINPLRNLQVFQGWFKGPTTSGLLAFDYAPNGNKFIRPGASGGVVIDNNTGKVVGIFDGLDGDEHTIALAVPVESLAEFLDRQLPLLAEVLFPIPTLVPKDQPDLYPKYEPTTEQGELKRRPAESNDVAELRKRAQSLAEDTRNLIAVQTFVWGRGNHHPIGAGAYEVQVRDGAQAFRKYPNGKTWLSRSPRPEGATAATSPGDVWSTLPLFIGTHVGVTIRETPDAKFGGRNTKVFQYLASAEDNPCVVDDVFDLGAFSIERRHTYVAYGEVWTDERLNIIRMSLHCAKGAQQKWQEVMNYGWLSRRGIAPEVVPVALVAWSPSPDKGLWCRSRFVKYQEFASRARLVYGQLAHTDVPDSHQNGQTGNPVTSKLVLRATFIATPRAIQPRKEPNPNGNLNFKPH